MEGIYGGAKKKNHPGGHVDSFQFSILHTAQAPHEFHEMFKLDLKFEYVFS